MSMVRNRERRNEDGMSIIGVVIASLLIMLALIPAAALLESTLAVSADNQHRVVAANLATQQMESIRNDIATQGFTTWLSGTGMIATTGMAVSPSTSSVNLKQVPDTVGSITYTVDTNLAWSAGTFQQGGCTSITATATQAPPLLEVSIKVTWPNERLATPVTLVSSLNAPTSLFNSNDGNVLISVIGAGGTTDPQSGILVYLYPGSPGSLGTAVTGTTDPTGCYFFPNLAPGPYTAEVISGGGFNTGYLGQDSTGTVSQSFNVAKSGTTGLQFVYDLGALFTISGSTQAAIGSEFGLLANDSYLTAPLQLTATGNPATYGPVFPNSSGYQTWLGACPASQFTPASAYETLAATSPGQTTSISGLQYSTLDLTLQSTTGQLLSNDTTVNMYIWQYGSTKMTSCNATAIVVPVTTNAQGQATVPVPVGYFAIAAALPGDLPLTTLTSSIVDASTPGPVSVPTISVS